MSGETTPSVASLPWRKRHPVFSRVVLYTLGAGLVALLVILLKDREGLDEEDRQEALRMQLLQMPALVMNLPGGHDAVLKKLKEDQFTDASLPEDIKGVVERTRALAQFRKYEYALGKDPTAALDLLAASNRSFERARSMSRAEDRPGLVLEWAEKKLAVDDPDAADALLREPGIEWEPTSLGILHAYMRAAVQIQRDSDDKTAAVKLLEKHLSELKAPLSANEESVSGGRPWSAAEAAAVATERLARWRAGQNDPSIWTRLVKLTPTSVQAQLSAAAGLASLGHEKLALSAWKTARELNEKEAVAYALKAGGAKPLLKLLKKSDVPLK